MALEQFIDSRMGMVMNAASAFASAVGSKTIRPQHLLAALVQDDQVAEILKAADGDFNALRAAAKPPEAQPPANAPTTIYLSRDLERILNAALQIARQLGRAKIDVGTALAAMAMAVDTEAGEALRGAG